MLINITVLTWTILTVHIDVPENAPQPSNNLQITAMIHTSESRFAGLVLLDSRTQLDRLDNLICPYPISLKNKVCSLSSHLSPSGQI